VRSAVEAIEAAAAAEAAADAPGGASASSSSASAAASPALTRATREAVQHELGAAEAHVLRAAGVKEGESAHALAFYTAGT
jgi:hypothetical protein